MEPKASTNSAPRATEPRSATDSGNVPEDVKNRTFTSLGFWKTKIKITANTTIAGSIRIQARDVRVDVIGSGASFVGTTSSLLKLAPEEFSGGGPSSSSA